MKTNYLLSHKYKTTGWILFIIGLISGIFMVFSGFESDLLNTKVLSIFNYGILNNEEVKFFKIIDNSIVDEITALFIIIGGLIVGFSKEKIEDEFIYKLRTDSLVWAIIFNYLVLIFTIIFIYDMTFLNIMIFNMFTPLVFFVFRFNFLKHKAQNHDE